MICLCYIHWTEMNKVLYCLFMNNLPFRQFIKNRLLTLGLLQQQAHATGHIYRLRGSK